MDDIVVSTLGKSTVDITERHQPLFGHTTAKGDGMAFGYTDVEGALRHLLHHDIHRTATGHSRGHADNLVVLTSQFQQGLTKHVLETGGLVAGIFHDALTGLGIKLARGVPDGDILLGGGIAVTFLGVQV